MDTIKGFAETVWSSDSGVLLPGKPDAGRTWSRPDDRTGSLELRRITTRKSKPSVSFASGVRTDFYELYWADLTGGSTWDQFTAWVRYLLFRPWSKVPKDVRLAWLCLWGAAVIVGLLGALSLIPEATWKAHVPSWLGQKIAVAFAAAILALMHRMASGTFGRVVRYTRADPDNIAARKAVRERGLALLRALHRDETYDRVVVVGHSLGTILAHDLVSYFWAEQIGARTVEKGTAAFAAVSDVEAKTAALKKAPSDANRAALRQSQAQLGRLLRAQSAHAELNRRWLISDLVTLGSPLTHAEFLLADGVEDLDVRCRARELPTCPPYREEMDAHVLKSATEAGLLPAGEKCLMTFPVIGGGSNKWVLHHAAPFAAVRWTNVYDPARMVAQGDMISGPLRDNFGEGIVDLDISQGDRQSIRFTHTRYWSKDQPPVRLATLRKAVNILDQ